MKKAGIVTRAFVRSALCIALAFVIALGSTGALFPQSAKSASAYSRDAACAYAREYAFKTCSDGYLYPGNDCAHFVSCCIGSEAHAHGGGLDVPSACAPAAYGQCNVSALREWLRTSGNGVELSSVDQLEPGDVILYDWEIGAWGGPKNGVYDHAALYLGNHKAAAHTTDLCDVDWLLGDSGAAHIFIHIVGQSTAFTISASAGANGSIYPSGSVSVGYLGMKTFQITPNSGYKVASVLVDGASVGAVTSYIFDNVVANHTISASFSLASSPPTGNGIRLYDGENYGGDSVLLPVGKTADLSSVGFWDRAESIKFEGDCAGGKAHAVLCSEKDFGGDPQHLEQDSPTLGGAQRNHVRSVEVYYTSNTPPTGNGIRLYDGENYGGDSVLLPVGKTADLSSVGFWDRAESIKFEGDCAGGKAHAVLCSEKDFGGDPQHLEQDSPTLGGAQRNHVRSVELYMIEAPVPPPNQPVNLSPANGSAGITLTPTLQGSPFSGSAGVTHAASRWQIRSSSGDYNSPVWDSGSSPAATSITVPAGRLSNGAVYYWRVGYQDSKGQWSSYSLETPFTTAAAAAVPPTVVTNGPSGIGSTSATLSLGLTSLGTASTVQVSFEWGAGTDYGNNTAMEITTTTGSFSAQLTGLSPGTTYHFRGKAVGDATSYGGDSVFTTATAPVAPPTVETTSATWIGTGSATLNGVLTGLGSAASVQMAFEWGLTTDYGNVTLSETVTVTGAFGCAISGLAPGTTYHFRVKAVGDDTTYGEDLAFVTGTEPAAPPTVATTSATWIGTGSATLNGILTGLGSAASVQMSFEWGLATVYSNVTPSETVSVTGAFECAISGLAPGTTYHFRVKAVGDETTYGEDLTFMTGTEPAAPPTVTTTSATWIGTGSATLNGILTGLGSAASVQVSFDWGLSTDYGNTTLSETVTATGAFARAISGLAPGTTYHFRVKAVGDDIIYGEDLAFMTGTEPAAPPTVTTGEADAVTSNSARLHGELTGLGTAGSVMVSFVWGTIQGGPYPNETAATAQTANGSFSFTLSGLASGVTFYYKAIAVGDSISYGMERSIATPSATAAAVSGAPTIASLTANHGRPGDDLTVTVSGSRLTGTTAVSFGAGIVVNNFRVVSDTEITAKVSIGTGAAAGKRDVTVTTPQGTATSRGGFTVSDSSARVHLWVYPVAVAGGLIGLGLVAALAVWLLRRPAKPTP